MIRLVDVGARGGIHERWKPFHSQLEVVGFEPDEAECARLNARQWPYKVRWLPHALGARDGEKATLHITKAPGCSSLLEPDMDVCLKYPYGPNFAVERTVPVVLSRMDTVLFGFQPDVMKVDTQGTEVAILEGCGALLDGVKAIELEVEFMQLYRGQLTFSDVDLFMRSQGFQIRGLRRTSWGKQLAHGDALYVRPNVPKEILAAYERPREWLKKLRRNPEDWHDKDFF